MATLDSQNQTFSYWDYLFKDLADPRSSEWPLLADPIPVLSIFAVYLLFVLKWGPNYMKDRKPYNLKKILLVYNIFQVIASTYIFYEAIDAAWRHYNWTCQPVDYSRSPRAMRVARGVYLYFLSKITELLDTVFFVLRKNDRQITFLHIYHHCGMMLISWGTAKYIPGGHGTFVGLINCFVHIIMYSYYLLAALGPKVQKYLWWKKYITTMQMAQFCMIFLHNAQLLFYDCGFPKWTLLFTLPNSIFFYHLFNDFYKKAYNNNQDAGKNKVKAK